LGVRKAVCPTQNVDCFLTELRIQFSSAVLNKIIEDAVEQQGHFDGHFQEGSQKINLERMFARIQTGDYFANRLVKQKCTVAVTRNVCNDLNKVLARVRIVVSRQNSLFNLDHYTFGKALAIRSDF
jgi:hypothetical protein